MAASASSASSRTSSATTANPCPVCPAASSPARAASIAAFRARRLVCPAISSIVSTIWMISSLESPTLSMVSAVAWAPSAICRICCVASATISPLRSACWAASRVASAARWTLRAFSLIVWFICSTAAATSSAWADCSSAAVAIWSEEALISSVVRAVSSAASRTETRVRRTLSTARLNPSKRSPISSSRSVSTRTLRSPSANRFIASSISLVWLASASFCS